MFHMFISNTEAYSRIKSLHTMSSLIYQQNRISWSEVTLCDVNITDLTQVNCTWCIAASMVLLSLPLLLLLLLSLCLLPSVFLQGWLRWGMRSSDWLLSQHHYYPTFWRERVKVGGVMEICRCLFTRSSAVTCKSRWFSVLLWSFDGSAPSPREVSWIALCILSICIEWWSAFFFIRIPWIVLRPLLCCKHNVAI